MVNWMILSKLTLKKIAISTVIVVRIIACWILLLPLIILLGVVLSILSCDKDEFARTWDLSGARYLFSLDSYRFAWENIWKDKT